MPTRTTAGHEVLAQLAGARDAKARLPCGPGQERALPFLVAVFGCTCEARIRRTSGIGAPILEQAQKPTPNE